MKKKRIGRPTRKAASAEALRALVDAGIDPATIDPRAILAAIAADASSPASARVAACKVLLQAPGAAQHSAGANADVGADRLSERALGLLNRVGRAN